LVLPHWNYAHWASRYPRDFEEAGYTVEIASRAETVAMPCGGGGRELPVDLALDEVDVADYDAFIYVGGSGCRSQWDDEEAHRIAIEAVEQGKVVAAAGCASTILAHAGVLEGRRARICTTDAAVKRGEDYCELLTSLGAICVTRGIVRDGLIITDRPRSYILVPAVLETLESLAQ
jgi:protease I